MSCTDLLRFGLSACLVLASDAGSIIELSADELLEAFTLPPGYKTYPFNGKRFGVNFREGVGALKVGQDLDLTFFDKGAIFDGARLCSVAGGKSLAGCNSPDHALHVSYFAPSSNQKTYVTLIGFLYTQFDGKSTPPATVTFFDMDNKPTETLSLPLPSKFPQRFVSYQCPPKRCHSFTLSSPNCMLQHVQYVLSQDPTQELWRQQTFVQAQAKARVDAKKHLLMEKKEHQIIKLKAERMKAQKTQYLAEVNKLQTQIRVAKKLKISKNRGSGCSRSSGCTEEAVGDASHVLSNITLAGTGNALPTPMPTAVPTFEVVDEALHTPAPVPAARPTVGECRQCSTVGEWALSVASSTVGEWALSVASADSVVQ
jgi:hypothetical protein